MKSIVFSATLALTMAAAPAEAELNPLSKQFVTHAEPVIALTNATVIDGTGAAPKPNQTLVMDKGRIIALGDAASVVVPVGAKILDMAGKTLLPGFVMTHEHMFFSGIREFADYPVSFSLLYLAGGGTTVRTAGTLNADADLNLRDAIAAGEHLGPDIDVTGPYLEGKQDYTFKMPTLTTPKEVTQTVDYWAGRGVTSFKAYNNLTRAQLKAGIDAAHRHGTKITGHLCSVTYAEAANLGIDNLEHGFGAATDFVKDKKPDVCPDVIAAERTIAALDPASPEARRLIELLVRKKVAVTSTLPVFEGYDPTHPSTPNAALGLLTPELQVQYLKNRSLFLSDKAEGDLGRDLLKSMMRLEKAFADAGGLLTAGSDPTGIGGTIPGFASKRQFALLLEAGFTVPQAVRIMTLNGAVYLGRDKDVGSLAVGKRADVVVIDGDLVAAPAKIEAMPLVFKAGAGVATKPIFDRLKGVVGLW